MSVPLDSGNTSGGSPSLVDLGGALEQPIKREEIRLVERYISDLEDRAASAELKANHWEKKAYKLMESSLRVTEELFLEKLRGRYMSEMAVAESESMFWYSMLQQQWKEELGKRVAEGARHSKLVESELEECSGKYEAELSSTRESLAAVEEQLAERIATTGQLEKRCEAMQKVTEGNRFVQVLQDELAQRDEFVRQLQRINQELSAKLSEVMRKTGKGGDWEQSSPIASTNLHYGAYNGSSEASALQRGASMEHSANASFLQTSHSGSTPFPKPAASSSMMAAQLTTHHAVQRQQHGAPNTAPSQHLSPSLHAYRDTLSRGSLHPTAAAPPSASPALPPRGQVELSPQPNGSALRYDPMLLELHRKAPDLFSK